MENATKALLIAAAILIAILIISLSLAVYNMAAETVGNVNLSEAEMTQFNRKFQNYEGNNVSGAQVNALLNTVVTHNQQETAEGSNRYVTVKVTDKAGATISQIKKNSKTVTKVSSNGYYTVTCTLKNGLVSSIAVKQK